MKKRNKLMMSGLMALVLGLGISSSAFAYQGDLSEKGRGFNKEFHSKMTDVMNRGDYEAWRELIKDKVHNCGVKEQITKENFPRFVEAWKLAQEGKIKEANAIRKELGLRDHNGPGKMNKGQGWKNS